MRRAAIACALLPLALGGCGLPIQAELDGASRVAQFATHYDHPIGPKAGLIDRALAECGDKTAASETACVRAALVGSGLAAGALASQIPGCRVGRVCHYEQTTRDRLGFLEANATDYVHHWRVDLDLRRPAGDAGKVPAVVVDRDDFEAAPAKAK